MIEKTIMLCCSAGMSTSLLVTKMKKVAKNQGKNVDIFACPAAEADDKIAQDSVDCILLGPQVRYLEGDFKHKVEGKNIGLDIINMEAYGLMDGEKNLAQAYQLIDK